MSFCQITRPGKLRRLAALIGKPVALALYRGSSGGMNVGCEDGTVYFVRFDGMVRRVESEYYKQGAIFLRMGS